MSMKFYTAAVALLTLAACNNDENYDPLADGPVAAQVTAGISRTMTRVSTDDGGAASFSTGDKINVVANGSTYNYSYDGTDWSAVSTPYYSKTTKKLLSGLGMPTQVWKRRTIKSA